MQLTSRIVLHIPEKVWIDDHLTEIPVEKPLDELLTAFSSYHCYVQQAVHCCDGKQYPEKLITIFCGAEVMCLVETFLKWAKHHRDELHIESIAYEISNMLFIERLD